jgi:hypothetical protein
MYGLAPEIETFFSRLNVVLGSRAALRWQEHRLDDKAILSVFVVNMIDGVRHRAFLVPQLSIVTARTIVHRMAEIVEELSKVELRPSGHLDRYTATESSNNWPISKSPSRKFMKDYKAFLA